MFNFLCAVVAIYMFRRNDPFHFANMSRTMVTLYRFETLQSWEMVLYINMFGCDRGEHVPALMKSHYKIVLVIVLVKYGV